MKQQYLVAYNGALWAGWALIGMKVVRHLASGGAFKDIYPVVKSLLNPLINLTVLEIVHVLLGLVRSPLGPTVIQTLARLLAVHGAMNFGSKDAEASTWSAQTVVAWTLSELVRYGFYLGGLVRKDGPPHAVKWLRYSAFIALYPIGISGEMGCFYKNIDFAKATGKWSIRLPNTLNFAFDYAQFIKAALVLMYPPGSYVMYTYMLAQRRKTFAKGL